MKPFFLFLALSSSLIASPESKLIYWGGIAEQQVGEENSHELGKEYPYLANIRVQKKRSWGSSIGSGGLFSDSWVITAKHVVSGYLIDPTDKSIRIKFPDGTVRIVVPAMGHPKRDIAILKLNEPVEDIETPSTQSKDLPPFHLKGQIPMTLTGTNGGFIAIDVMGQANDERIFSPDILRGGDSGAPVIVRDGEGRDVIVATLTGPYDLDNSGRNGFIGT